MREQGAGVAATGVNSPVALGPLPLAWAWAAIQTWRLQCGLTRPDLNLARVTYNLGEMPSFCFVFGFLIFICLPAPGLSFKLIVMAGGI